MDTNGYKWNAKHNMFRYTEDMNMHILIKNSNTTANTNRIYYIIKYVFII